MDVPRVIDKQEAMSNFLQQQNSHAHCPMRSLYPNGTGLRRWREAGLIPRHWESWDLFVEYYNKAISEDDLQESVGSGILSKPFFGSKAGIRRDELQERACKYTAHLSTQGRNSCFLSQVDSVILYRQQIPTLLLL